MRILHTADWHIGKSLARRQRLDEAGAALKEVVAIAQGEKVDAVLVCGDIYEHLTPSPEAEALVYETLLALEQQQISVVIIPGNHDSPKRWSAVAPLLQRFSVVVIPEVLRPERGGVVEVKSRDRSTIAQIACLPWVSEQRMISAIDIMGLAEAPNQTYADEMARLIKALCSTLDPKNCTLFAGHLFVSGSKLGGGERSLTVGQIYSVTPQAMPQVQYVALGHVHRPQRVQGSAVPARYAGSLLQLDFGETGQKKSVALVDVVPGKPAVVHEIPITAGRQLLDVSGTMEELAAYQTTKDNAFLRATLRCDGPRPGLADEVRDRLPNAIEVRLEYPRLEENSSPSLRGMAPREQFARYYAARHSAPAGEAMLSLFDKLLEEAGVA
jgi:DNA repair protein SbcD/Mre11